MENPPMMSRSFLGANSCIAKSRSPRVTQLTPAEAHETRKHLPHVHPLKYPDTRSRSCQSLARTREAGVVAARFRGSRPIEYMHTWNFLNVFFCDLQPYI